MGAGIFSERPLFERNAVRPSDSERLLPSLTESEEGGEGERTVGQNLKLKTMSPSDTTVTERDEMPARTQSMDETWKKKKKTKKTKKTKSLTEIQLSLVADAAMKASENKFDPSYGSMVFEVGSSRAPEPYVIRIVYGSEDAYQPKSPGSQWMFEVYYPHATLMHYFPDMDSNAHGNVLVRFLGALPSDDGESPSNGWNGLRIPLADPLLLNYGLTAGIMRVPHVPEWTSDSNSERYVYLSYPYPMGGWERIDGVLPVSQERLDVVREYMNNVKLLVVYDKIDKVLSVAHFAPPSDEVEDARQKLDTLQLRHYAKTERDMGRKRELRNQEEKNKIKQEAMKKRRKEEKKRQKKMQKKDSKRQAMEFSEGLREVSSDLEKYESMIQASMMNADVVPLKNSTLVPPMSRNVSAIPMDEQMSEPMPVEEDDMEDQSMSEEMSEPMPVEEDDMEDQSMSEEMSLEDSMAEEMPPNEKDTLPMTSDDDDDEEDEEVLSGDKKEEEEEEGEEGEKEEEEEAEEEPTVSFDLTGLSSILFGNEEEETLFYDSFLGKFKKKFKSVKNKIKGKFGKKKSKLAHADKARLAQKKVANATTRANIKNTRDEANLKKKENLAQEKIKREEIRRLKKEIAQKAELEGLQSQLAASPVDAQIETLSLQGYMNDENIHMHASRRFMIPVDSLVDNEGKIVKHGDQDVSMHHVIALESTPGEQRWRMPPSHKKIRAPFKLMANTSSFSASRDGNVNMKLLVGRRNGEIFMGHHQKGDLVVQYHQGESRLPLRVLEDKDVLQLGVFDPVTKRHISIMVKVPKNEGPTRSVSGLVTWHSKPTQSLPGVYLEFADGLLENVRVIYTYKYQERYAKGLFKNTKWTKAVATAVDQVFYTEDETYVDAMCKIVTTAKIYAQELNSYPGLPAIIFLVVKELTEDLYRYAPDSMGEFVRQNMSMEVMTMHKGPVRETVTRALKTPLIADLSTSVDIVMFFRLLSRTQRVRTSNVEQSTDDMMSLIHAISKMVWAKFEKYLSSEGQLRALAVFLYATRAAIAKNIKDRHPRLHAMELSDRYSIYNDMYSA